MKKLFIPCLLLLAGQQTKAQLVGTDAFMMGDYVEVGISGAGGFEGAPWSVGAPPVAGSHYRSGNPFFGFVANPQMDGWTNFDGDFFTPGTPENGWGIEIVDSSGTVDIQLNNNCAYVNDIAGAITSYNYSGGLHTVIWEGNYTSGGYDLDFTIEYNLYDGDLSYTTTVSVVNNGATIEHLYYYRNLDPDNNQSISGDFVTTNEILSQPSSTTTLASVKATSIVPWTSTFTFSSNDSTARVSSGGFSNRSGADIWNGVGYTHGSVGYLATADEAISIACKWDSLFHFRSANMFTFTTAFGPGMATSINETNADDFNVYPNPTNGLLTIVSKEPVIEVTVHDVLGGWHYQAENISTVDLSAVEAGIYFVTVKTEKSTITKRIVKE